MQVLNNIIKNLKDLKASPYSAAEAREKMLALLVFTKGLQS